MKWGNAHPSSEWCKWKRSAKHLACGRNSMNAGLLSFLCSAKCTAKSLPSLPHIPTWPLAQHPSPEIPLSQLCTLYLSSFIASSPVIKHTPLQSWKHLYLMFCSSLSVSAGSFSLSHSAPLTLLSFSNEFSLPASASSPYSHLFIAYHQRFVSNPVLKTLWEVTKTCSLLKQMFFLLDIFYQYYI